MTKVIMESTRTFHKFHLIHHTQRILSKLSRLPVDDPITILNNLKKILPKCDVALSYITQTNEDRFDHGCHVYNFFDL